MRRDEEEEWGGTSVEDGCGWEEKEGKTEAEVDGQCKCWLEGEDTIGKETQNRAVWRQLVIDRYRPDIEMETMW